MFKSFSNYIKQKVINIQSCILNTTLKNFKPFPYNLTNTKSKNLESLTISQAKRSYKNETEKVNVINFTTQTKINTISKLK